MLYFVLYNAVSFYTTFLELYDKWIREPYASAYNALYSEKIVAVKAFNLKTKRIAHVFSISTLQIMYDMLFSRTRHLRGLDSFIPTTNSETLNNIIYEITTWDGNEYYVKGHPFYMDARPSLARNKNKFLFVGLDNKHDATNFFNKHSNSFNSKNAITVFDFMAFAMLKGICEYESYAESIENGFVSITFVTCEDTLQGHTYKDNDTLVLQ
jgi:hypothetical protein